MEARSVVRTVETGGLSTLEIGLAVPSMSPVCDALVGGLSAGDVPRLEAWLVEPEACEAFAAAMMESEGEGALDAEASEVCSVMTLLVWRG
jgi:hypothetical protein